MGSTCAADQTFPEIWKENVIDLTPKPVITTMGVSAGGRSSVYEEMFSTNHYFRPFLTERSLPGSVYDYKRAAVAAVRLLRDPRSRFRTIDEVISTLSSLEKKLTDDELILIDICSCTDCMPAKLAAFITDALSDEESRRTGEKKGKKGKKATRDQVLGLPERSEAEQPISTQMGLMGEGGPHISTNGYWPYTSD